MEGHSSISTDVLASYAADAALETPGVTAIVESPLHRHHGVRVTDTSDGMRVEIHLSVEWGATVPEVGAAVQTRVADYLGRMADVAPVAIDVVVDAVAAPPAAVP